MPLSIPYNQLPDLGTLESTDLVPMLRPFQDEGKASMADLGTFVQPYKKFVCNVNQFGTSDPTITEFENNIGLTYTIIYTGVGTYTITFDAYYFEDYNVWMQISNYNTFDSVFTHLEDLTITITGYKGTAAIYSAIGGALTDDILRNASLEIRFYPLAP